MPDEVGLLIKNQFTLVGHTKLAWFDGSIKGELNHQQAIAVGFEDTCSILDTAELCCSKASLVDLNVGFSNLDLVARSHLSTADTLFGLGLGIVWNLHRLENKRVEYCSRTTLDFWRR